MSNESLNDTPQESTEVKSSVNIEDYGGRVILEDGGFKTEEGIKLTEKDGELYVAEGEDDAGTRMMKVGEIIPSGF